MLLLRPSTNFQKDVCVQCAYASRLAYQDDGAVIRKYYGPIADRSHIIIAPSTDTQLHIAGDKGSLLVAFRGTSDLRDWITDCEIAREPWHGRFAPEGAVINASADVHSGFLKALNSVWPKLFTALCQMRDRNQYVTFTGHSLGGALAMLASQRWAECGFSSGVYTFGQPRVWNAAGAEMFDRLAGKFAWRVVHANDVVTRVPWLLGNYRHAGNEVFFDALDRMHINPSALSKLPSDIYGLCREWKNGKLALLADHSMDRYLELLLPTPAAPGLQGATASTGTVQIA